jgi:uncharacterized membrane protein YvbJ
MPPSDNLETPPPSQPPVPPGQPGPDDLNQNVVSTAASLPSDQNPANNLFPESAGITPANQVSSTPNQPPVVNNQAEAYLDAIAPQTAASKKFFSGKVLLLLGGVFLVLIIVIIVAAVASNMRQGPIKTALALGDELTNLQTLIKYGQTNKISTPKSVKISAEINLIAQSHQNQLGKFFNLTVAAKEDDQAATVVPAKPGFVKQLDTAKSLGNLETAYIETLESQLDKVDTALANLKSQTDSTAGKNAIAKTVVDIKELQTRLTEP